MTLLNQQHQFLNNYQFWHQFSQKSIQLIFIYLFRIEKSMYVFIKENSVNEELKQ